MLPPFTGGPHCGEQFAIKKTELNQLLPPFTGGLHCGSPRGPLTNEGFSDTRPDGLRSPLPAGGDCPKKVLRSRRVQQLRHRRFPYGQGVTLSPAGIAGTDEHDPLAPEPAKLTGALIGYARVSTSGQILDRQTRALTEAGCIRVFADKLSGKTADRPELAACLDYLRAGDTLVVPSLDRLSRSLQDLITIVAGLRRRGVGFRSLHEALDTTTPGGRLVFHVFAALAEFIRELIVEGTREGLDAARARGQRLGRPRR